MNRIKGLLLLVAVGLLVFFITRSIYEPEASTEQVGSTVLLQRIRPVMKLVTVEGDFSEIYSETITDKNRAWLGKYAEKSVLLRANARMSVGYDLKGISVIADEGSRTITLRGPVRPEILSTEYDFQYYDLKEGLFAEFLPTDISNIEKKAKAKIISAAAQSGLFLEAAKGRIEAIAIIRALVETSGWTFVDASGEVVPVKG